LPGDDKVARATKRQPSDYPGMLTRKEIIDYYCERTGTTINKPRTKLSRTSGSW
jgi:hypothetical protein